MKKTFIFIATLVLLLVPCGAAYAYNGADADENPMIIEPADPAPQIIVYGNAIGGVEVDDLFYVDITGTTADTPFTLYMTNVDELIHSYRYMNLNIGIYMQTDTDIWEKLNVTSCPDMYLTMQNGLVNFTLPGGAKYKVTLENGCYRSYHVTPGNSIAMPSFYLTSS